MNFLIGCLLGGTIGFGLWAMVEEDWLAAGLCVFATLAIFFINQVFRG